jgi:hypothetical protein
MVERLQTQFADPNGVVPSAIAPLVSALAAAHRPRSVLMWLSRPDGSAQILRDCAASATAPTHEFLDGLPPSNAVLALRHMLMHTGALESRLDRLERLPAWLDRMLATVNDQHRQILRSYGTWRVIHNARRRATIQFTAAQAGNARVLVTIAAAFLAWIGQQHLDLPDVQQPHLDQWLAGGGSPRRLITHFLKWASRTYELDDLTVPQPIHTEPVVYLSEQQRWTQLRRCLHEHTLPLDVRISGALILLYGLWPARIGELTDQHLITRGNDAFLRIGAHATILPPALAVLVRQLIDSACGVSVVDRARPGTRWLFPSHLAGQHASGSAISRKLNTHGLSVRPARNAALIALAAELPAAALSPTLGLSIEAAVNWCRRSASSWNSFVQARAAQPDQSTARPDDG